MKAKEPDTSPKPRVSRHKELAVVTLAMVASISGVGGLLAANQQATAQTTNANQQAAITSTAHPSKGEVERDGYAPSRSTRAEPARDTAPSFSFRSNTGAPAVSQGS